MQPLTKSKVYLGEEACANQSSKAVNKPNTSDKRRKLALKSSSFFEYYSIHVRLSPKTWKKNSQN